MSERPDPKSRALVSFLLTQIGTQAAMRFAERLSTLDLLPQHAGVLRILGRSAGMSQQELAGVLGMHASRLVAVVDTLEKRGFVERKSDASDRRVYALHLTEEGRVMLKRIGELSMAHDDAMCQGLSRDERSQLADLLQRIAEQHGLTPGVHPGYRTLGRPKTQTKPPVSYKSS